MSMEGCMGLLHRIRNTRHPHSYFRRPGWQRLLAVLCLALPLAGMVAPAPALAEPNTPAAPSGPASAPSFQGVFPDRHNKNTSARIAVDAGDGLHAAWSAYGDNTAGDEPAYYAYCPDECRSADNWTLVALQDAHGSMTTEVQLALTPAGQPRILTRGYAANYDYQFQYMACDNACTLRANWTILTVATTTTSDVEQFDYSQHYFALDHLGRPGFIYYTGTGEQPGSQYRYCHSNCASLASWHTQWLAEAIFDRPSLAYTGSGLPRIAAVLFTGGENEYSGYLAYLECNLTCSDWAGTYLWPRGNGHATFVLRLDGSSRPRILFRQAEVEGGGGNKLAYAWCNTDCQAYENWDNAPLSLAAMDNGGALVDPDADLALDSAGRPHIAYRTGAPHHGIGYAWCSAACESAGGTWHSELVEPSATLNSEWPRSPVGLCDFASWYGGYRASLALDSADRPAIAYDTEHLVNTGLACNTVTRDYMSIRLLVPGSGGVDEPPYRIFLPMLRR
jgi:hypothetical protein